MNTFIFRILLGVLLHYCFFGGFVCVEFKRSQHLFDFRIRMQSSVVVSVWGEEKGSEGRKRGS